MSKLGFNCKILEATNRVGGRVSTIRSGGISWSGQDITQLWYPSHTFLSEQGVIVGAYTFAAGQGQRFSNQSLVRELLTGWSKPIEYTLNMIKPFSMALVYLGQKFLIN